MTYKESLENMGYKLQDFGNHWRTQAVYRNGKTATSVMVYKDSGVWRDFGGDCEPLPFELLVKKTLKTEDPTKIKKYLASSERVCNSDEDSKIEMEKIYPKSMLEKLLPIRAFYEKRGIPDKIQNLFECGYSGSGKMYRRIVFPIYDLDSQIHGFSGRLVADQPDVPKWKHIGRKSNWLYPHHLSSEYIEQKREVILVESIGDCLALYTSGYRNVLVTFGIDISPKLLSYLNSFNLDRIIVSLNNDIGKETNSGAIGAIKVLSKLSTIFDLNILSYNPPLKENDFGDMLTNNVSFSDWYSRVSKWNMSDIVFQSKIKKKILDTESLYKQQSCQKLIKVI
jgi:hypothetical protein